MERKEIFKERLKMARAKEGLSLEALSKIMGGIVSKQALNKYELGTAFPSSSILIRLADALKVTVSFFFRPIVVSLDKEHIYFRKRKSLSAKVEKRIKVEVADEIEKYIQIEQILDIENQFINPIRDIEIRDYNDIIKAVHILNSEWGLRAPAFEMTSVIERFNIKVIFIEDVDKFDGLCGYFENIPFIIIKRIENAERQRFTLLHELGHLLLNLPLEVTEDEEESFCNNFASELLLPSNLLINITGEKRKELSLAELTDLQRTYGISPDAVLFSLKYHQIIQERYYVSWQKRKNKDSRLKELFNRSLCKQENSSRFLNLVMRALSESRISISKAAELLNISVYELETNYL